jgi:hypothetical protein
VVGVVLLGLLVTLGVFALNRFGVIGGDDTLSAPATLAGQSRVVSPDLTRQAGATQQQIQQRNSGAEAIVVAYGKPDSKLLLLHGVQRGIDISREFRDARVDGPQQKIGKNTCAVNSQEKAVLCLRTDGRLSIGVYGYRVSGAHEVAKAVDEAWDKQ